ncbi:MAG: Wzz/FepE/Etk N-terminal domain-containing protein [Pseudomonadota bacterium]
MLQKSDTVNTQSPYATQRVRAHYDQVIVDILRALWRRRLFLIAMGALGLMAAIWYLATATQKYTADAIVKVNFAELSPATNTRSNAALQGALLVEGEARLIRSMAIARRVVDRLNLDKRSEYARTGTMATLINSVRGTDASSATSTRDVAAMRLSRELKVSNDTKSYLITISITSDDPDWSAKVANAFAIEYLGYRQLDRLRQREFAARTALSEAKRDLGDRHPQVISATATLASAVAQTAAYQDLLQNNPDDVPRTAGHSFFKAEPSSLPAGPNMAILVVMSVIGTGIAGVGLVLLGERNNTTLRTEAQVVAETGVRCVGVIPAARRFAPASAKLAQREAIRAMCVSTGLTEEEQEPVVVMVSAPLPDMTKAAFVKQLSSWLAECGKRVLVIDPLPSKNEPQTVSLEDVQAEPERMIEAAETWPGSKVSYLKRKTVPTAAGAKVIYGFGADSGVSMTHLLKVARSYYDVTIIDTPPTLLTVDSILVGRKSDMTLMLATWNKTPKEGVNEAIARLQTHGVQLDGMVLAGIDLDTYSQYETTDRLFFMRRHQRMFSRFA